jgi:hypothetical protein
MILAQSTPLIMDSPKEHATIFKENVDNMEILPEIQIQQAQFN